MKVKQISKPGGDCYDCVFFKAYKKGCYVVHKASTFLCNGVLTPEFKPWVQAADGTHSWNKAAKTLQKISEMKKGSTIRIAGDANAFSGCNKCIYFKDLACIAKNCSRETKNGKLLYWHYEKTK